MVERIDRRVPGARDFVLRFWDGSEVAPPAGVDAGVTVVVRRPEALSYALRQPNELGLGRAWVTGALDVEGDLERGLALRERFTGLRLSAGDRIAAMRAAVRLGALSLRGPAIPASEARLAAGRRHSVRRDRAAVRHHYDVSNAFYRMLLGPTMVYSCAYFASPDDTLEEAQTRKLALICRKLRLQPGERLLDVGCGWGSLVIHAAREHGVRAVGVTLSEPQAELARARVRDAGLSDRCEIRVADYREVDDGPYDKVASVGMYEHVGRARLADYVGRVKRLLRPGGLFLNHGIVRAVPRPWGRHSFIARYVFPDGELHPVGTVIADGAGRPRDPRRRVAPRALRADTAPLGRQPRRQPRRRRRRGGRGARARLAPLHDRLGAGLRGGRHLRAAGPCRENRRFARTAAGAPGAAGGPVGLARRPQPAHLRVI